MTGRRRLASAVVLGSLAVVAWLASRQQMHGMMMSARFSAGSFGFFLGLWIVMMAAMMFPSLWPTFAIYGMVLRNRARIGPRAGTASAAFLGGYLLSWTAYGLVGFGLLEAASRAGLGSLPADHVARYVVAPVAFAAALYQLGPVKQACLRHCRGPLSFLLSHWQDGLRGALSMGARHGLYCVGCCWMLMLVLLAFGTMSLTWMAVASIVIAVEKLTPTRSTRLPSGALAGGLVVLGVLALVRPGVLPVL